MSTTVTYSIPNISCNHCVHTITMELNDMEGVSGVVADMNGKQATVTFDPPASEDGIKALLSQINYPVAG